MQNIKNRKVLNTTKFNVFIPVSLRLYRSLKDFTLEGNITTFIDKQALNE